jgi:hypothetical protein
MLNLLGNIAYTGMRAQNSENHVARIILAWVPGNFNYILYG